jgi:hypothetical protein
MIRGTKISFCINKRMKGKKGIKFLVDNKTSHDYFIDEGGLLFTHF